MHVLFDMTLNHPNPDVKPDWWCVALDETKHWNLSDEDKPFVKAIMGVYFYDANEYTYCCEITPSHYLRGLRGSICFRAGTPDDVMERITDLATFP